MLRIRGIVRRVAISILVLITTQHALLAHTVSIGYIINGPGAVTMWYGSYHVGASFNEGSLRLTGPQFNSTVPFFLLSLVKPAGLVDGTNNFYSNGTSLTGTPVPITGHGGSFTGNAADVRSFQGANFTGLAPGTYTFTYIPIAVPTFEWDPIDNVILTNSFTLTAAMLLGIPSFASLATNVNQTSVATGIDNAIAGGAFNQAFYNLATLTPAALAAAFTQLSGEAHTQAGRAAFQSMGTFLMSMLDPWSAGSGGFGMRGGDFGSAAFPWSPPGASPYGNSPYGNWPGSGSPYGTPPGGNSPTGDMVYGDPRGNGQYGSGPYGNGQAGGRTAGRPSDASLCGAPLANRPVLLDNCWGAWMTPYGGQNTVMGNDVIGSHDTTIKTAGLIAGLDYQFAPGTIAGVAVSGGTTSWGLSNGLGGGSSEVFQTGLYASTRLGPAYLSGALAYSWYRFSTDRTVTLLDNDTLTSTFRAQNFGGRIESGYRLFDIRGFGATPYAAAQVQSFRSPSYSETVSTGLGTFALNVTERKSTNTRTELGFWLDQRLPMPDRGQLMLRARAAWLHSWMNDPSVNMGFQTFPGANFTVIGAKSAPNALLASAGAELLITRGLSIGAKFDGEFATGSKTFMGTGLLRYQW